MYSKMFHSTFWGVGDRERVFFWRGRRFHVFVDVPKSKHPRHFRAHPDVVVHQVDQTPNKTMRFHPAAYATAILSLLSVTSTTTTSASVVFIAISHHPPK